MRNSRRIKRMSRNRVKITKMNLTSLMDVFTILVFFLLVNSGSVEVLDAPKDVKLPESRVEAKPRETVVIFVSPEEVLVQGKLVAFVEDILNDKATAVEPIMARLAQLKENIVGNSTRTVAASQEVTILADRSVPFTVVKTIMSESASRSNSSSFFGTVAITSLPFVISMPASLTITSTRKLSSLLAAPPVELGRFSSTIVSRENTAVINRNGTSTTIRLRKVVTSSS